MVTRHIPGMPVGALSGLILGVVAVVVWSLCLGHSVHVDTDGNQSAAVSTTSSLAGRCNGKDSPERLAEDTSGKPSPVEAVSQIDGDRLMSHMQYLCTKIGPRPACSINDRLAMNYIRDEFRSYGYTTSRQRISLQHGRGVSENIVASVPSAGKVHLVVGAHHDSVSQAAGANDNASGVAVMLEVARVLRGHDSPFDVTFVSFGAEENAHEGSQYFVRSMDRQPAGMINLDMVAVGDRFQIGGWCNSDDWLVRHCECACDLLAYERQSNPPFGGKSDYASFVDAGIPVACYAWDPDPNMHTAMDRLDMSRRDAYKARMEITAKCLLAALLSPRVDTADRD